MTHSIQVILHAFLGKCAPNEQKELLTHLTINLREALAKLPKIDGEPLKSQENPQQILNWVHPSWMVPFFRTLPEKEIGLFLVCLNPQAALSVKRAVLYNGALPSISPLGETFLRMTLFRYLIAEIEDLLPIECLPASPLNLLIQLPTDSFIIFLDLLGLHDLSVEIRQIVDRQRLSKIYDALTDHQHSYLKILNKRREPVIFNSIWFMRWDGDKEKLKFFIRQRGANRLGKALYGQDPSLVWYVLHRFDMEKALLLHKLFSPIDNAQAVQILIQQAVELVNHIRRA